MVNLRRCIVRMFLLATLLTDFALITQAQGGAMFRVNDGKYFSPTTFNAPWNGPGPPTYYCICASIP